jgi:group I intron endonuclease
MKSGIYLLKFINGDKYVGRSIDIERRWFEHVDSMKNGKAAKSMQAAFDRYGYPHASVLLECHSDHIDLMESYYICKLQPELNTVPGITVTNSDFDVLEQHYELLQESTVDHLNTIMDLRQQKEDLLATIEFTKMQGEEKVKEVSKKLKDKILAIDVNNKIESLEKENLERYQDYEELLEKYEAELSKPWWKKLW